MLLISFKTPFAPRRAAWYLLAFVVIGSITFTNSVSPVDWPIPVKKKLYATDYRGKKAPKFVAEHWLTKEPSLEGKVILFDFWATWCPPCRKAIPELNELQKRFKNELVVIGISDESTKTVRSFMQSTKMEYAQAIDSFRKMKEELNIKGIPHVLIVSTDGIVRWQGFPFDKKEPLTAEVVAKIIAADPGIESRVSTN